MKKQGRAINDWFELQNPANAESIPGTEQLQNWATLSLEAAGQVTGRALCLRVVSLAESRSINQSHRSIDKPTNVLAFPVAVAGLPESLAPLGDLVVCADIVAREAAEQLKPEAAHWCHMVVHGTLHLLGYDHQSDEAANVMEALETQVVTRCGFRDPYTPLA